jgi:hypothetical protein
MADFLNQRQNKLSGYRPFTYSDKGTSRVEAKKRKSGGRPCLPIGNRNAFTLFQYGQAALCASIKEGWNPAHKIPCFATYLSKPFNRTKGKH